MKNVLVIDGGGLKGVSSAVAIAKMEMAFGKCSDKFDLIVGTSTGSIIGGCLAAGVSGEIIKKFYIDKGAALFIPRDRFLPKNWGKSGRYDREIFISELDNHIGGYQLLDVKTLFLTTAFNLCSGRTHFIHSDCKGEGAYQLSEVISWSALSAVYYFGKICVPSFRWDDKIGAVFQDGGQGTQNSPVIFAVIEAVKRWKDEKINLISIGCGTPDLTQSYAEASRYSTVKQVIRFISQARNEAPELQHIGAAALDKCWDNFSFQRYDYTIPKKYDLLDGTKYIDIYVDYGKKLGDRILTEMKII